MTTVIKHSLRVQLDSFGGYRPEGWCPRVSRALVGPVPAGGVLEWTVTRPDGSVWFADTARVREAAAGERTGVELRHGEDGSDEAGTFGVRIRLVSALDGVDELLHDGSFTVVARDGEHRYAVDNAWLGELGLVRLDTAGLPDAPRLQVTAFLPGDAQEYQLEAHCFSAGTRLTPPASITTGSACLANDGEATIREVTAEFEELRGWNNQRGSGWGDGWHLLDENDGTYEVVFLRDAVAERRVRFKVSGGRIVSPSSIEPVLFGGEVIVVPSGGDPGPTPTAFYGDPATAAAVSALADVYRDRVPVESSGSTGASPGGGAGARAGTDGGAVTADAEAVQAFVDRVERLLQTWEHDMTTTSPPFDFAQTLAADAVVRERDDYLPLLAAVASVPDATPATLAGAAVTIGELRIRVAALFAAAEARLATAVAAEEDALAPYRAVLRGDKLTIFEDHPAGAFEYLTTDRSVIETPEELSDAEYWYFEGASELSGTVTADGVQAHVTAAGWRVSGWQFDSDGNTLDRWEVQGAGSSAPLSAFRRD